MDANKRTLKKRQMPHQMGGSNTASLRTPKNTTNYFGSERGWSAVKSLPSRKYDIATLMAIGKDGGMNSIVARFSSHTAESKHHIFVSKLPLLPIMSFNRNHPCPVASILHCVFEAGS